MRGSSACAYESGSYVVPICRCSRRWCGGGKPLLLEEDILLHIYFPHLRGFMRICLLLRPHRGCRPPQFLLLQAPHKVKVKHCTTTGHNSLHRLHCLVWPPYKVSCPQYNSGYYIIAHIGPHRQCNVGVVCVKSNRNHMVMWEAQCGGQWNVALLGPPPNS